MYVFPYTSKLLYHLRAIRRRSSHTPCQIPLEVCRVNVISLLSKRVGSRREREGGVERLVEGVERLVEGLEGRGVGEGGCANCDG